jgi:hypothetical protein
LSEDREDSRQQFEEGESPLLKRILFGMFAGIFVTAIKFGGLFGISSSSIREGILGILAAGRAFGVIIGVVPPWVGPEERFKWICMFAIAGGAAGTTTWMIVQPDTSLVVAVGANALLGGLYYIAGLIFG